MAESPQLKAVGVVRLGIHCAGRRQAELSVLSVNVHHALNDLPWARLVLADGDMANGSLALSDGELFEPGADIAVCAGYGDAEETIFTGIVVGHSFSISGGDGRLTVLCRASACKMTEPRRTVVHGGHTDGEVIEALIGHAGLTARVSKTDTDREVLVQHDCSDWEFMLARAGAMGLLVNVEGDTVSVQPPPVDAAAALTLTWGVDLIDFDADIEASAPSGATQAPHRNLEATLARVGGRMSFQGSALARAGAVVELAGLGKRFSGPVLLSSVEHEIRDGDWITRARFGLGPQRHAQPAVVRAAAGGGLQTGDPLTAENAITAIVTRSRHRIEFNDDEKLITITTPARNQLVFSDQDQAIEIKDQSGNIVRLSEAGIALHSPRDITLAAQGGITLDAAGAVSVRSKADVSVEGLNVACQAQLVISAKGVAAAELSSSGQTTVKGAMVMIN